MKAADLNQQPVLEKRVCSDSNRTAHEEKMYWLQPMLNTTICINKRFDNQLEQSENENPACKKWFKVARSDQSYSSFSIDQYVNTIFSMDQWLGG